MSSETWKTSVEAGGVAEADASIEMGSGELSVSGGAETLLDGTFEYSVPDLKPTVNYEIRGDVGHLRVQPPSDLPRLMSPDPRYVWTLQVGDLVPLDLDLKLGSGRATLDLARARVVRLGVQLGSGQVDATLADDGQADLQRVAMTSGSGRLSLMLRGEYPDLDDITLSNASGLTDLVLGGTYPALERLRLNSASGNINVGLTGQLPKLAHLDVRLASGGVDLNLAQAAWTALNVSINCVSGVATVRYPAGTGVFVRFSSVTGRLDAPDLAKTAGGYATPNYGEAVRTLHLSVSTVSGKLILQPSDA